MKTRELHYQLSVLKDIQQVYPGKTIDNVIQQIDSRIKEQNELAK